ncbi:dTDP-4-dehydrorhamnose 3,5-epimerase [Albibacterium bauzanense]|uniref:dTDP-4-dehydrorhamnose 3,5-epimerase n=1 Tax=Albibacterium bauzanense TaxID=653929 RepID=A0A4V2PYB8_9SPHI|nr:dTDP-4-dehydrorhamnose 3,5-epimerase [Albibacterium bauzanense]TCK84951.1 dTDP-4-dehydrorhamnose 3,5-epimerase [Albibacterium bauzanense]
MEIINTGLAECFIIKPKIFEDSRGYFFESFNETSFKKTIGKDINFVQDNQSYSSYGVIRGLHAQSGDYAQAKLVRVLGGGVLDVAVDARPESSTYGKHIAVELTAENKLQLFIPRGFLHGFAVLSKTAEFFYKCDNLYKKEAELGVSYNSPELGIDWIIPQKDQLISQRDLELPLFLKYNNSILESIPLK